jgi:hypothetical protein
MLQVQDIVLLPAEFGRVPITPSSLVSATPALLSTTGAELLFEHPDTPYFNAGSNYNAYSTWEAGAGAEVIVDAGKVYNVTEVSFYKAFTTADRTPRLYQIFSGESASGPWIEQGSTTFTGTLTQDTDIKADGMNFNTRYIRYLMSGMDDPIRLYMHEIVTRGVNRLASGTDLNLQTELTALKADNTIVLPAIEYPPSLMTQNTQVLTGGTYAASASASLSATFLAFKAFDGDQASVWPSNTQYNATTGVHTGAATTLVDAVNVSGAWLQLVMPTAVAISSVTIRAQPTATDSGRRSPRDFIVAALVDGTCTQVMQRVGVNDWTESEQKAFEFDAIQTAASYRIITQRVGNSANGISQDVCTIAEVRFIEQPVVTLATKLTDLGTTVQNDVNTNSAFKLGTTLEYPPSAMTQATQWLTGGIYTASGSSASNANLEAYKTFDGDAASQWLTLVRYDATTGVYTGAATTLVDAVSVGGEWMQLTMPTAVAIFSVVIQAGSFGPDAEKRSPRDFVVAALVDGAWTEVMQRVNINNWGGGVSKTFFLESTPTATAYRIIIQRVGNFDSSTFQSSLMIAEVRFIAYEVTSQVNKLTAAIATAIGFENMPASVKEGTTDSLYETVSGMSQVINDFIVQPVRVATGITPAQENGTEDSLATKLAALTLRVSALEDSVFGRSKPSRGGASTRRRRAARRRGAPRARRSPRR